MQAQPVHLSYIEEVLPHDEAKSTEDYQQRDGHYNQRVAGVVGKAGIRALDTAEVEPCVAECSHAGEHAHPDAESAVFPGESYAEQHCACALEYQRVLDYADEYAPAALECAFSQPVGGVREGAEAKLSASGDVEERDYRDEPQTAYLYQQHDHSLPEYCPVCECIRDDESGDAGG